MHLTVLDFLRHRRDQRPCRAVPPPRRSFTVPPAHPHRKAQRMTRAQETCNTLYALGYRYVRTTALEHLYQLGPFRIVIPRELDAVAAEHTIRQGRKMAVLYYGPGVRLPMRSEVECLDPEEVVLSHGREILGEAFGMPQARRVLRRFGTVRDARRYLSDLATRVRVQRAM